MVNLVIKDNSNQIVRSVLANENGRLEIVIEKESRRIRVLNNTQVLEQEEIEFDSIGSVDVKTLRDRAYRINANLSLVMLSGDLKTTAENELPKEDERTIIAAYKWSGALHAAVIGGLVLVGLLLNHFRPEEIPQTMEVVVLPPQLEKPVPVIPVAKPLIKPVVKMAEHKSQIKPVVEPVKVKNPILPKPKKIVVQKVLSQGIKVSKHTEIGTLKTLAKLGGIGANTEAKNKGTGFGSNSGAFGQSKGGAGGGLGSGLTGGLKDGLSGKGLVGGLSGAGSQSYGAHGYGTGKFGGGRTGHGGGALGQKLGEIVVPAFSDSEIVGGLTREQVEAVVRRNQGQLLFCYEKALQSSPKLRGRITSQWTVGPTGLVTSARVASSSLNNSEVETCVTRSIRTWKFPHPVGGVHVDISYPFDFGRLNLMAKEN